MLGSYGSFCHLFTIDMPDYGKPQYSFCPLYSDNNCTPHVLVNKRIHTERRRELWKGIYTESLILTKGLTLIKLRLQHSINVNY